MVVVPDHSKIVDVYKRVADESRLVIFDTNSFGFIPYESEDSHFITTYDAIKILSKKGKKREMKALMRASEEHMENLINFVKDYSNIYVPSCVFEELRSWGTDSLDSLIRNTSRYSQKTKLAYQYSKGLGKRGDTINRATSTSSISKELKALRKAVGFFERQREYVNELLPNIDVLLEPDDPLYGRIANFVDGAINCLGLVEDPADRELVITAIYMGVVMKKQDPKLISFFSADRAVMKAFKFALKFMNDSSKKLIEGVDVRLFFRILQLDENGDFIFRTCGSTLEQRAAV